MESPSSNIETEESLSENEDPISTVISSEANSDNEEIPPPSPAEPKQKVRRTRKTPEQRAAERAIKIANGTAQAKLSKRSVATKTPEQRLAEREAKKSAKVTDEQTKVTKPVRKVKTEEEKIEEQARKELEKASKSKEEKTKERLERRKKVEEVKANILHQTTINSLPKNWPPADFWRKVAELLSYPQKAKLRGTHRYFYRSFFDREKWIDDSHAWIISQGFTAALVLRLLGVQSLLREPAKCSLKREELDCIERQMKKRDRPLSLMEALDHGINSTNPPNWVTSPELLRALYKAFAKKRKNFTSVGTIVRFYNEKIDAATYKGTITNYWKQVDLSYFSRDALLVAFATDRNTFIRDVFKDDNVAALEVVYSSYLQGLIDDDEMRKIIGSEGLHQYMNKCGARFCLEFIIQKQWKTVWLYPQDLVNTLEFPEFFHGLTNVADVITIGSFYYSRETSLNSWRSAMGYKQWYFDPKLAMNLTSWSICTRRDAINPWQKYMKLAL